MDGLELLLPEIQTDGNLATMQLPDAADYNYWNLYTKRIMAIEGEIDEWDYHIVKDIISINIKDKDIPVEEREPIILLINSYGGNIDVMFSIIDIVKISTTPVWTVNMGNALSAASIIFLSGSKRFVSPNSWCMTHLGSGTISGNYNETNEAKKVWDAQLKTIGDYIVSRTGMDEKVWKKNKNKDWYLNSDQQLEFGFGTDILESMDQILVRR